MSVIYLPQSSPVQLSMDLLNPDSPAGITVRQVTPRGSSNRVLYPDRPQFLANQESFLYEAADGFRICHPGDDFRSELILESARAARGALVGPGGYTILFLEPDPALPGQAVRVVKYDLEDRTWSTLAALEKIPGTRTPASQIRFSTTISADGNHYAAPVFLGDGTRANAPFGILVFDLGTGECELIAEDPEFINAHLQYCQSPEPEAGHDLMVQHNHGALTDENGGKVRGLGPPSMLGNDIHIVRDDGTNWRTMPWGRDGRESCIGHEMWRGQGTSGIAITLQNDDETYGWAPETRQEVVEGWPVHPLENDSHSGNRSPRARRSILSRNFPHPRFCHLFCGWDGNHFAFDTFDLHEPGRPGQRIYTGLTEGPDDAISFHYLLNSGGDFARNQDTHAHPVVSPDRQRLYFNSRQHGETQIYMVEGPGLWPV